MRALEIITGHVIYNPAYTYKFQLKTTYARYAMKLGLEVLHRGPVAIGTYEKLSLPVSISHCHAVQTVYVPYLPQNVIVSLLIHFLVG